jgi:hypothetical protein
MNSFKLCFMEKIEFQLSKGELDAVRKAATRSRRSVSALVREAIRKLVLAPRDEGPAAIWNGKPKRTSMEHDSIHDKS